MAVTLLKIGNTYNFNRKYFLCEKLSELQNAASRGDLALTKDPDNPEKTKLYISTGSNSWAEYVDGSGGSSSGITREEVQQMIDASLAVVVAKITPSVTEAVKETFGSEVIGTNSYVDSENNLILLAVSK